MGETRPSASKTLSSKADPPLTSRCALIRVLLGDCCSKEDSASLESVVVVDGGCTSDTPTISGDSCSTLRENRTALATADLGAAGETVAEKLSLSRIPARVWGGTADTVEAVT